jgi:hypothetical protein
MFTNSLVAFLEAIDMKFKLFSLLLGCACASILFVFLILPDLVMTSNESIEQNNWFIRLFYGIFLSNPLFGAARAFNNPAILDDYLYKYRNSDRDSLIISIYLIGFVFTLVPIFVMLIALSDFYSTIGWLNYLFTLLYGFLVAVLQYYFSRLKLARLKENAVHEK